jgi:hypothetical protein
VRKEREHRVHVFPHYPEVAEEIERRLDAGEDIEDVLAEYLK